MKHPNRIATIGALALFFLEFSGDLKPRTLKADPSNKERSPPLLTNEDDAKTVISKAAKAHGGSEAYSRWNCGHLRYKTKGGALPTLGETEIEDTFQLPGHFKRTTRTNVGGKELVLVFVLNDGKGWTKKGDGPAEPTENKFTERSRHPFSDFCNVTLLTEADVTLTKLGAEKINGKDAIGVRAKSDKLGEVDFFFSVQTGLLLKSRKSLPGGEPGESISLESYLDDYKQVQGAQVPMRIKGVRDGKPLIDVTLVEAKFADKFDRSVFDKP